jgi:DNA-binding response OmpR family regulator
MSRILFAEDTEDLNRAVTAVLTHEGYDVTSVLDGLAASEALASASFDVVILDVMMPGKDGLEVLRDMRAQGNVTPVIMLTAKVEVDDRVAGLEAGADDYLPKPFAMKELLARLRSLARRNTDYGNGDVAFGDFKLCAESQDLTCESSIRLSRAEFTLLRTLVLNPGRPLSADVLLERVWEGEEDADKSTVSLYIRYLTGKLDAVNSSTTVVERDGGWMLEAVR